MHLRVANDVEELDDVGAPAQVLQDFDFAPDFLFLDLVHGLGFRV